MNALPLSLWLHNISKPHCTNKYVFWPNETIAYICQVIGHATEQFIYRTSWPINGILKKKIKKFINKKDKLSNVILIDVLKIKYRYKF